MDTIDYESLAAEIRAKFSKRIDDLPRSENHFAKGIHFVASGLKSEKVVVANLYCICEARLVQICCLPLSLPANETVANKMVSDKFAEAQYVCSRHIDEQA